MWHTRTLADGEALFEEGEATGTLAQVVSGTVRLVRGGQFLARVGPDGWLGEATAFVEDGRHFATARAEGPVVLRLLRRTELRSLRQAADPDYLELLIQALRAIVERIESVNAAVLSKVAGGAPPAAEPGRLARLWARVTEAGGRAPDALPVVETLPALTRADATQVARSGRSRFVPTSQALVVEGDLGPGMFLVLSGALRVVRSRPDGTVTELALAGPGALLGTHSTLRNQPRGATLVAGEPTWVLELTLDSLPRAVRPAFAECLAAVLGAQLAAADVQLMALSGGHPHLDPELGRVALGLVEASRL